MTLAQAPIAEKSNKIPAPPPSLRSLPSLEDTLITADLSACDAQAGAMHCQQGSARVITQELGGD